MNTKRRCCVAVFSTFKNRVGVGRDEEDYHQAVKLWLKHNQVPFTSKQPHSLLLHGQVAHKLFPDVVAWNEITLELKCIPRSPGPTEFVQLFDHLKCRGDRLGLLVNMGLDRVHVKRIVYDPPSTHLEEDWSYWSGGIGGSAREVGIRVREALRTVYKEHATGYGDEVVRKLILFTLGHHNLSVVESPVATSCYGNIELSESALDCLVVEDVTLLTYTAFFDNNNFNMNRGRSYLKALDLH